MTSIQSALVKSILQRWGSYEWSVQGFGFIRTKIQDVGRIHIWDARVATPHVSTMHSHPWPLRSTIISGELLNQRFISPQTDGMRAAAIPYMRSSIATGEGGGLIGDADPCLQFPCEAEFYVPGESYTQQPQEVHRTIAQDGTVTLLERPQGPPLEEALVFWPLGTKWVSAEPRPAGPFEVEGIVEYALSRWNAR